MPMALVVVDMLPRLLDHQRAAGLFLTKRLYALLYGFQLAGDTLQYKH